MHLKIDVEVGTSVGTADLPKMEASRRRLMLVRAIEIVSGEEEVLQMADEG